MYHYQKNIGDYRSATMHLSLLEHGVYNQLLDWYYLDEAPLSLDNRTLFRRLSARSEVEQQAVLDVLTEMFVQTDGGWVHKRVEREISQYKAKANQAREAGKLGGRPPKKGVGFSENRDGSETKPDAKPTANQEPLTINQEPIKTLRRKSALPPDFSLTESGIEYANAKKLSIDDEIASFINWHTAKGSTFKDWQAAWRTWCDKAVEFGRAKSTSPPTRRHESERDRSRRETIEGLTGMKRNERDSNERDITGIASVVG